MNILKNASEVFNEFFDVALNDVRPLLPNNSPNPLHTITIIAGRVRTHPNFFEVDTSQSPPLKNQGTRLARTYHLYEKAWKARNVKKPDNTPYLLTEALTVIYNSQRSLLNIATNKNFDDLVEEATLYTGSVHAYYPQKAIFDLLKTGIASVLDATEYTRKGFVETFHGYFIGKNNPEQKQKSLAGHFHDSAAQIRSLLMYEYFNTHKKTTAGGRNSRVNNLDDTTHLPASYQGLFGAQNHIKVDHEESIVSPAAYLVELDDLAKKFIHQSDGHSYDITTRRPDLADTPLTKAATNTEESTIKLVQGVLASFKQAKFPNRQYPNFSHIDEERLKKLEALKLLGTDLATWYNQADKISPYHVHHNYCRSNVEYYQVLNISAEKYAPHLKKTPLEIVVQRLGLDAYAITSLNQLTPEVFMQQAGLSKEALEEAVYGGTTQEERVEVLPFLYTNNHLTYDDQNHQGANRYYLAIDWDANQFQLVKNHIDNQGKLTKAGTEYLHDAHYEFIDRLWRMILFSQRGKIAYAQGLWFISMPLFGNAPTSKQSTETTDTLADNSALVSNTSRQFARLHIAQQLMQKHGIGFNDAALLLGEMKPYGQDYTLVGNDGHFKKTNMLDYFFGKMPDSWVIHTEDTRDQNIANALKNPILETCLGVETNSIDFGLFFKHAYELNYSWQQDLKTPATLHLKTTHRVKLSGFYRTRLLANMYGTSFNEIVKLSVQACLYYVRNWGPYTLLLGTHEKPIQKESIANFIDYLDEIKDAGISMNDAVLMTGLTSPEEIRIDTEDFYNYSDQDDFYTSFARQMNLTAPGKALLTPLYAQLKNVGLINDTTLEVVANPKPQGVIDQHYAAYHKEARVYLTNAVHQVLNTFIGKPLNEPDFAREIATTGGAFLAFHAYQTLTEKAQEQPDYLKKMEALTLADTQGLLQKIYAQLKTIKADDPEYYIIGNEIDHTNETVNIAETTNLFKIHGSKIFANTAFSKADSSYGTFLNTILLIDLETWIHKALKRRLGSSLSEAEFIDEVRTEAQAKLQSGDAEEHDRFLWRIRWRQIYYESISNGVDGTDLLDGKQLANLYNTQASGLFPGDATQYGVNDLNKDLAAPFSNKYRHLNEQLMIHLGTTWGLNKEQSKVLVDFGHLFENRLLTNPRLNWKNVQVYEVLHPKGRFIDHSQDYLQALLRFATIIRLLDLSPDQIVHVLHQYTPLRNTNGGQNGLRFIDSPKELYLTPYMQIRLIWFNNIVKRYSADKQAQVMALLKAQSTDWEDKLFALGAFNWTKDAFDTVINRHKVYSRLHLYWHSESYYPSQAIRKPIDAVHELFSLKEFCDSTGLSVQNVIRGKTSLQEMLTALRVKKAELQGVSDTVLLSGAEEQIRDHQVNEILHYCRLTPALHPIKNANQLSEYLLTDVEVNSKVSTSKVKFAIAAYQTLINRTLHGLENDLKIANNEVAQIWEWSKHYRTWEANRKVYLYPENYLDPQLLPGASALYKKFTGDINAAKINDSSIEQAYKAYLNDWVNLQHLDILEAKFVEGDNLHSPKVYLLSKSRSNAAQTYLGIAHLKKTGTHSHEFVSMDAWKPIETLAAGAHPTLCYEFGRIFIFFLDFAVHQDVKKGSTSYAGFRTSIKYTTLNLSGKFDPPQEIGSLVCKNDKNTTVERISLDDFVKKFTAPTSPFEFGVKPTYQSDKFAVYLHAHSSFLKNEGEMHHPWYVHADLSVTHAIDSERKHQILVWGNEGNNQNTTAYTNSNAFQQNSGDKTLMFKAPDGDISNHGGPYYRSDGGTFYLKKKALADLGLLWGNSLAEGKEIFISFWFRVDNLHFDGAQKTTLARFTINGSQTNGRWELNNQGELYFQVDGKYKNLPWWKFHGQVEAGVWYHLAYRLSPTGGTIHLHFDPVLHRFKDNRLDKLPVYYPAINQAKADRHPLDNHYYSKYTFNGGDNKSAYILSKYVSAIHRFDFNTTTFGHPGLADTHNIANTQALSFENLVVKSQNSKAHDNLDFRVLRGKKISNQGEWYLEIKTGEKTNANNESEYQVIRLTTNVTNTWAQSLNLPAKNFIDIERQFDNSSHFEHDFIHEPDDQLKYPLALRPSDDHIDFNSANGIYYNEMFMWMPLLIAKLYNQQGEYAQAQKWIRKVFNPALTPEQIKEGSKFKAHLDKHQPKDKYWQYIRLWKHYNASLSEALFGESSAPKDISKAFGNQDKATQVYYDDPFDPTAIADLHPKAYQEMIVKQYVQNIIDWGDSLYRQLTRESLTEAYMFYEEAYDLLGLDSLVANETTFSHGEGLTLSNKPLHKLPHQGRLFQGLTAIEATLKQDNLPALNFKETLHSSAYTHVSALYFGIPSNHQIDQVWQTLQSRFFNLRQNLDINGNALHLPLFQPPISPSSLIRAKARGQLSQALNNGGTIQAPHHRFYTQLGLAREFTQLVARFGEQLLATAREHDVERLTNLSLGHQGVVLQQMKEIKEQQLKMVKNDRDALQKQIEATLLSKAFVNGLRQSYIGAWEADAGIFGGIFGGGGLALAGGAALVADGISKIESKAKKELKDYSEGETAKKVSVDSTVKVRQAFASFALENAGLVANALAAGLQTAAAISHLVAVPLSAVPTIFGFSNGGFKPQDVANSLGSALGSAAFASQFVGSSLREIATHLMRDQEWEHQNEQLNIQLEQLVLHYESVSRQVRLAKLDKEINDTYIVQHDEMVNFYQGKQAGRYQGKFTNEALCRWMQGKLTGLYKQAYAMAVDQATKAQSALEYEKGLTPGTLDGIVATNSWDANHYGLLSAEPLLLSLQRLEQKYLEEDKRRMEITEVFSLAERFRNADGTYGKANQSSFHEFLTSQKGTITFGLGEMSKDYIPEDAIGSHDFDKYYPGHYCRQIKLVSVSVPSLLGPYKMLHGTLEQTSNLLYTDRSRNEAGKRTVAAPCKKIALSMAMGESGVHSGSGGGGYLPFEGTGVDSAWTLTLKDLDKINVNDIILTMHYTVRE